MNVLGFMEEDKMSLFKTVAGIMHLGNIQVKQRPREEWASSPTTTEAEKVAHLLGIGSTDLVKALTKPRIKVGNEYVQRGCTEGQVKSNRLLSSICHHIATTPFHCPFDNTFSFRLCMPLVHSPRACMNACSVGWWEG